MIISDKNVAVLGAQFGDEAKARAANWLAKDFRFLARFSGSSNAGHTIYFEGKKIVRRLLPAADFSIKDQFAFLAAGMVINPYELITEIKENQEVFPELAKRVIIDPNAFVITDKHIQEDVENVKKIGSTGKGVSPAYRDKIYRCGTKIADLIRDNHETIITLKEMGVQFKYVMEMYDELSKSPILFEGAQSVLLDYNFGTYPYVTSGECTVGGIFNAGFAFAMPKTVYGVLKAYTTRVGHGPFPTEIIGSEADKLRAMGQEYGAVTGRPRKLGWLDLPALDYACKVGGITDLIITKFDILNNYGPIKVATSYDKPVICASDFNDAKPNYTEIPGWTDAKDIKQLIPFLKMVEEYTGKSVSYVSYGVNKEDFVSVNTKLTDLVNTQESFGFIKYGEAC